MRYLNYFFFISCLIIFLGSCKKETPVETVYEDQILEKLNAYRVNLGLKALEMNEFMRNLARQHSTNIEVGSIPFGHDGATERYAAIRVELGNGLTAENIDWGSGTAEEVVLRWSESIGHKENIEGNFELTGIGIVKTTDGKYYYTQLFYKKN